MKNRIKQSIWVTLIVLANQLNAASTGSYLDVHMTGTKTFELTFKNLKGNTKLSFKDTQKQVLYYNTFLSTMNLKQGFDMNLISEGNYEIELVDSEKIVTIPIIIENDGLVIDLNEKTVLFLPVLNQKGNQVTVNMLALNDQFLTIKVRNSYNEVVHMETLKGGWNLGRRFDFSKTWPGMYEFQLISKGGVIVRNIIIK